MKPPLYVGLVTASPHGLQLGTVVDLGDGVHLVIGVPDAYQVVLRPLRWWEVAWWWMKARWLRLMRWVAQ